MKMKNLLFTAIASFGLATATLAQVPSYVPTSGLVGWYPFNGNANDQSVNGLNGNLVGGVVLTTDRNSIANASYDFDYTTATFGGQTDEVYIPYNAILNSSTITVSVWVYPRSYYWTGNPNTSSIITRCQYGYSNPNGQVWGIWMGPTNLNAFILAAAPGNNQTAAVVQGPILPLNFWSNVVFSYDGSSLKLYVNGVLINTTATSLLLNTAGNSGISIGESNQANGYWGPTDGKIDDIGIWNRALTQAEITALYQICSFTISTQPSNQSVNISSNAQFTVASSNPSATYQWQTDLGVGFQNLSNAGQYSGTTNDTLTISNTTMSNNNQPFRCIITSVSCTDTSDVAFLTVVDNVGINEFTPDHLFSVYPNPAKSVINVKADTKLIGTTYIVYDNTGKTVLSGRINSENTVLELGNLSGGVYLFSMGEMMKQTFKIIKSE